MKTTDFTGTYDYEKEEALHEAGYLIECLQEGYFERDKLPEKAERIRAHWQKVLPSAESFADWDAHFTAALKSRIEAAA